MELGLHGLRLTAAAAGDAGPFPELAQHGLGAEADDDGKAGKGDEQDAGIMF